MLFDAFWARVTKLSCTWLRTNGAYYCISVSEISRFFDLENARLKMDDLEISRDLEIGQLTY